MGGFFALLRKINDSTKLQKPISNWLGSAYATWLKGVRHFQNCLGGAELTNNNRAVRLKTSKYRAPVQQ
jgi:hypothetical protein